MTLALLRSDSAQSCTRAALALAAPWGGPRLNRFRRRLQGMTEGEVSRYIRW